MKLRAWIGSVLLLGLVAAMAVGLTVWKRASLRAADAAGAGMPEPAESVVVTAATERQHRRSTTVIGTVKALRSVELRNEIPGTIRQAMLTPGQVVEAGTLLIELDTSVEEADLRAHEAQATLASTILERIRQMSQGNAASVTEFDRARTERDVALALVARDKAVIARKNFRAPFRARIGMSDVHPGQYLEEGTLLTTLQGVDEAAHVDFTVAQDVAAGLREEAIEVFASAADPAAARATVARVVAVDARVDPATRSAAVRARVANAAHVAAPGASVRVRVPVGPARPMVAIPASALRRGPGGDHVFVVAPDAEGKPRARTRRVQTGDALGDEVLVHAGLSAGERVAAGGSFKLREAGLIAAAEPPAADKPATGGPATAPAAVADGHR